MNHHTKKVIAPLIVVALIAAYHIALGFFLIALPMPIYFKVFIITASLGITVVLIMVLIERVKEIKKGEEDDLGKY